MFTWICPKCGREVPPAYTECPDCTKAAQTPAQAPVTSSAAPPEYVPPPYTPAQPPYQPPQPVYPQQPYPQQTYPPQSQPMMGQVNVAPYAPPPVAARRGLPTWLLTILFLVAFLGLGAGVYWFLGRNGASSPTASVESPAAKPGAKANPYQKYIEISGVRFTVDAKKKPIVKFVVINHSPAEIEGLKGNVTIWGRTQKSEEEAAGTFTFSTSLGPWESKDLSAPLTTKKQMVELPDWQNVSTDIQITAPGA
jgi:hypothetical protein